MTCVSAQSRRKEERRLDALKSIAERAADSNPHIVEALVFALERAIGEPVTLIVQVGGHNLLMMFRPTQKRASRKKHVR